MKKFLERISGHFFSISATVFGLEIGVRYENRKRNGADPVNILVIVMCLKGETIKKKLKKTKQQQQNCQWTSAHKTVFK